MGRRLLVLNNYPLDETWDAVRAGSAPGHLLYGIDHLAATGWEVEVLPFRSSSVMRSLTRMLARSPLFVGDLDQQWAALRHLGRTDLVYAPCQNQTQVLAYLRGRGRLRTPLVALAHHPLNGGRLRAVREPLVRLYVRGHDALPALSRRVADEVNTYSHPERRAVALPWGPDAGFYRRWSPSPPGEGIVAVGRTARDFETLARAADAARVVVRVVATEACVTRWLRECRSPYVRLMVQPDRGYMPYPEVLRLCATARALAIPLFESQTLAGLTSLMDAMGLGKPVVMTRNPLVDLDVEAEGIGIWTQPGDVESWTKALQRVNADEERALAMGARARSLVASGFDSAGFAERLRPILERALAAGRAGAGCRVS